MATLAELATIQEDSQWNDLLGKIKAAAAIKASAIIDSVTPAAALLDWAKNCIEDPGRAGNAIAYYVIASNATATLTQIYTASDVSIQNNVNDAVDALYGG